MNRDPTLCREFVKQAKGILSQHPQIRHNWSVDADEDHCILDIPVQCEGGFDITAEVADEEITVSAGGAHSNANLAGGDPEEFVGRALGMVRDLLSPAMRVRERTAGGRAYKWAFEFFQDGKWRMTEEVCLLFWNWFGRRGERLHQNTVLPSRDNPVESEPLDAPKG